VSATSFQNAGDSVLVAAMAAMFGVFLMGLWVEARRTLRRVAERESVAIEASLQSWEAEYQRVLARRDARERLEMLRAPLQLVPATAAAPAPAVTSRYHDEDDSMYQPAPRVMGFERVGRIIERLSALDHELDQEMEAAASVPAPRFGELNLVQGGARTPETVPSTRSNATRAA
jgi:hypothetical protein